MSDASLASGAAPATPPWDIISTQHLQSLSWYSEQSQDAPGDGMYGRDCLYEFEDSKHLQNDASGSISFSITPFTLNSRNITTPSTCEREAAKFINLSSDVVSSSGILGLEKL